MINQLLPISKILTIIKQYQSLLFVILSPLAILILVYSTHTLIPFNDQSQALNFFYKDSGTIIGNLLSAWDGQWNLYLAEYWYGPGPEEIDPGFAKFGFFPLYPFTIKLLSPLFMGNLFVTGIFISLLTYAFALMTLKKLSLLDLSAKITDKTTLYYLISPASIFFIAIYSQSLFLLLSIAAIYLAIKNKWWLASILAMLAAMTKPQGFIIIVPLLAEYVSYVRSNHPQSVRSFISTTKANFIALILVPLGTILSLSLGLFYANDIYVFQEASKYFGNQQFHLLNIPNVLLFHATNYHLSPQHGIFVSKLNFVAFLTFLLLLIPIYRKLRFSYFLYSLFLLLIPLASGSMAATLRSLSISFPHFMILAYFGVKFKYVNYAVVLIFLFLMTLLSLRFVNWYWVS